MKYTYKNKGFFKVSKPTPPPGGIVGTTIFDSFLQIELVKLDSLKQRKVNYKEFYLNKVLTDQQSANDAQIINKLQSLESEIDVIDRAVTSFALCVERYNTVVTYYSKLSEYYRFLNNKMAFLNRQFLNNDR